MSNSQLANESAIALITKAEIDQQIATAKAFPRDLAQSVKRSLDLATMSQEVAEACIYALPRGGKNIEGPSVRLAEIIAASFGNMRSGFRVIDNDGRMITAQGICHDLETNNAITVEVQRRITDKNGKTFNDDLQVLTGNAAGAIAYRNAVFKIIPAAITQTIYDQVKKVAKGTADTLTPRVTAAIGWFSKKGVTKDQLFVHLGVTGVNEIDLDMLQTLTGYKQAITQDGMTIDELFNPEPELTVEEKKAEMRVDKDGQSKIEMP